MAMDGSGSIDTGGGATTAVEDIGRGDQERAGEERGSADGRRSGAVDTARRDTGGDGRKSGAGDGRAEAAGERGDVGEAWGTTDGERTDGAADGSRTEPAGVPRAGDAAEVATGASDGGAVDTGAAECNGAALATTNARTSVGSDW